MSRINYYFPFSPNKLLFHIFLANIFLCVIANTCLANDAEVVLQHTTKSKVSTDSLSRKNALLQEKNSLIQAMFQKENSWQEIQTGLHYLRIVTPHPQNATPTKKQTSQHTNNGVDILRFHPEYFTFSVYSAAWTDKKTKNMSTWLKTKKLLAAINASMFLPDNITSNGYLKKHDEYNNKNIGTRLGGFFVADPKIPPAYLKKKSIHKKIPTAAIVYRDDQYLERFDTLLSLQQKRPKNDEQKWQRVLNSYNVVVQNFKLFDPVPNSKTSKHIQIKDQKWQSTRTHSIAAIGEDHEGNILFLHAKTPMTITQFIKIIQYNRDINLHKALYTEGGSEASMSLATDSHTRHWVGTRPLLFFLQKNSLLPNIIGVKEKL